MNEVFINYAITLGFNPESPVFDYVVKNLIDLDSYVNKRKADKNDSMYVKPV